MQSTRAATKKELKKTARHRLEQMLRHGTTTVEIKSGYGLDPENETKMLECINELAKEQLTTIVATFLGAHSFPPEYQEKKDEYIELVCENMIPYIQRKGLAKFCDVFCEKRYFTVEQSRKILATARSLGFDLKVHADELAASGGSLLAAEMNAVSADHLEHCTKEAMKALADSNVIGVLLPGVSFFLNHQYAPARALLVAGVPVAIASDFNPGSCMSYSIPLMMTIACTQMKLTPEEAITATTLNAAAALKLSNYIGSIEVGKNADIVLFDIPNYRFLPYHFGENHVARVIKNGVLIEF
jgi:imidazolonepropionase